MSDRRDQTRPATREALITSGLRFTCQGTGRCCTARGKYGYVYLSLADRRRLAAHLGLRTSSFTRRFCRRTGGLYHPRDPRADCPFLDGRACGAHQARPVPCRARPFRVENPAPAVWFSEVVPFCPGVGKGPLHSATTVTSLARASDVSHFD